MILVCAVLSLSIGIWAQDSAAKPATPAATPAAKAAVFRPSKDQVMKGQNFLKEAKLYTGEATGIYNDDTRAAIRTWQKSNGLTVSGNFNQATLEKMNISTEKTKASPKSETSKTTKTASTSETKTTGDAPKKTIFKANAEQVKAAQKILIAGKMFTGEEDGKFSPALHEAVKKYQESKGIKATGGLNADTLTKMGIALTDKQKGETAPAAAPASTKEN